MSSPEPKPRRPWHERWQTIAAEIAGLMILCVVGGLVYVFADQVLPPGFVPWRALSINDTVGMATKGKIEHAAPNSQVCRAILSEGGVAYQDIPNIIEGDYCLLNNGLVLTGGTPPLRPAGAVMTCQEALAYAVWERQVVQPAAQEILGSRVVQIDNFGTYVCRRVNNAAFAAKHKEPPASEHSFGNAIDIAGFHLADGRVITVLNGWKSAGPEGRFLHKVRDGACQVFVTTLSPDYNEEHANHMHLDMGQGRLCS